MKKTYTLSSFHEPHQGQGGRTIVKDPQRCCETVNDGWWSKQCSRSRGHGPEEAYCKQHDPVVVKAREEEQRIAYEKKHQKWTIEFHGPLFLSALKQIAEGHNDPRSLAKEVIEKAGLTNK